MSRTQADYDNLLNLCINEYSGQKPDYWGYAGECLSLNKRILDVYRNGHLNGPMGAPSSSDGYGSGYWRNPPQQVLDFMTPESYDPNAQYPRGSFFVYTHSGHIGTLLDNQPGNPNAIVFEQNADPDGSPAGVKQRDKHRIDGILVLKVAAPQSTVQHQITDYSSPIKYNVAEGHNAWDLSGNTFAEVAAHPVDTAGPNKVITVTAVLHITGSDLEQYQYYLEDRNSLRGWNTLDCTPYVAPPKPYTGPAKPLELPGVTFYEVYPDVIIWFKSAADAKNNSNAQGVKAKGKYVQLSRDGLAVHLVKNNSDTTGDFWINDFDNKLDTAVPTLPVDPPPAKTEPVDPPQAIIASPITDIQPSPAPVKPQYRLISTISRTYDGPAGESFPDLEGKTPNRIALTPGKAYDFSMEAVLNGTTYYILDYSMKRGYRHGVPKALLYQPNMLQEVEQEAETWGKFLEVGFKSAERLITDIKPKLSQSAYRGKQFLDGFKAGKKQ